MSNPQSSNARLRTADTERSRRVHNRYEWLHILNDYLLAGWFLVGSILFFYAKWTTPATWLFVIGSAQMLIGPLLRTAHKLHLKKIERFEQRVLGSDNINF